MKASLFATAGFMVNTTAFGTAANRIGITSSSFSSCMSTYSSASNGCTNEPYGACTEVNAGSPYDQFSTFKTVSWLSYVPLDSTWTCSFLYNGIYQPGGTSFATQYG